MTLDVITPIFDEQYLLPIFLEHYQFADEITFFYDTDTTDRSLEVINKHKKTDVTIIEFNTGDGLNDYYMIHLLHKKLESTSMNYSICVDADELLFHTNKNFNTLGYDIKQYISEEECDFYCASFFQMYPYQTEPKEITWDRPIWDQRKYGEFNDEYLKPCIIKKECDYVYSVGKHFLFEKNTLKTVNEFYGIECMDFPGCHLNNINLERSIERRVEKRKNRMSRENTERGAGSQYYNLTEDDIRGEFLKKYPKLW